MIDEIRQIKTLRKKIGMTQKELAKHAQVSQSLIAKIESNTIDPAYSRVKKIMGTLQVLSKKEEKKASEMMMSKIIKLTPKESIRLAIKRMKQHNISQMPVFEEKQVVGLVSENVLLDAITNNIDVTEPVEKVMREAPPTISPEADQSLVIQMLKQYPLVVVSEKGKAKGIITKADLFESVYK